MFVEKLECFLQVVKNDNIVVDRIETLVQRICDYFSSMVFSENRSVIISVFNDDPDEDDYNNDEEHRYQLAHNAVIELNELFASHGLETFFDRDIENRRELQNFARDISIELFKRRRKKQCTSSLPCAGGIINFVSVEEAEDKANDNK